MRVLDHCHASLKTCLILVENLQSTMMVDLIAFSPKLRQLPRIHMLALNIKPLRFLWYSNYLVHLINSHDWDYCALRGYNGIT